MIYAKLERDLNKYLKTELNVCNLLIFFIS